MENQRDYASSQFNGDWIDKSIILPTELKLPSPLNPMDTPRFDNDTSFVSNNHFEAIPTEANLSMLDIEGSLSTGELANGLSSFDFNGLLPMSNDVPLFISNDPITMENHQMNVTNPSNTHWFNPNGSFPSINHLPQNPSFTHSCSFEPNNSLLELNQQVHAPTFVNTPWFGSNDSVHMRNQQTDILRDGTISLRGSKGPITMKNQQFNAFNFPKTPLVGSNSYLHTQTQQTHLPTTLPMPWYSSNVSLPLRNQMGLVPMLNVTNPLNHNGSFAKQSQQSFIPNSSNACWLDRYRDKTWIRYGGDDRNICQTCHKIFPSTQALGGHMGSHTRARKREAKIAGLIGKPDAPLRQGGARILSQGSGSMSHVSTKENYSLGMVEKKIKIFDEVGKKPSKPTRGDIAEETSSRSNKIAKKVSSPLNEVLKKIKSSHEQEKDQAIEQDDHVEFNEDKSGKKKEHPT